MNRRDLLKKSAAIMIAISSNLFSNNRTYANDLKRESTGFATPDRTLLLKAVSNSFISEKMTCSEAMMNGFCKVLNIESTLVPDIALGLGGGIGLQGNACGVLTGGIMTIGIMVGSRETDYNKKKMRVATVSAKFLHNFNEKVGTISCRKITHLNLTTSEGREQLKNEVKESKCVPVLKEGVKILADVLKDDELNPSYDVPASYYPKTRQSSHSKKGQKHIY